MSILQEIMRNMVNLYDNSEFVFRCSGLKMCIIPKVSDFLSAHLIVRLPGCIILIHFKWELIDMKTLSIRIVSLLICVVIVLSLLPSGVFALAEAEKPDTSVSARMITEDDYATIDM